MITAVVFCPAAPWLIPSVAPTLLSEQSALRQQVGLLVDSTDVARWAALGVGGAGNESRWDRALPLDLGRDPYRGGLVGAVPIGFPGSHWVARAVLGPVPLDAGALAPDDTGREPVISALAERESDGEHTGLLVTADGSTAHGEHAPGAPDDRAAGFDADLHTALVGGPAATRAWLAPARGTAALAAELGATLPTALHAVLDTLTAAPSGWDVEAHDFGAPYGVGHHVVRWRRR